MKGQITLKDIKSNMRRYTIQYNQDELDNISSDKIIVWKKYVEMNDEKKILIDRINKATLPYIIYGVAFIQVGEMKIFEIFFAKIFLSS